MPTEPMLSHSVYFLLNDRSREAKRQLVAACKQYLEGHPGTVFFGVGVLAEEIAWSVSDRDFDVALHVVFRTKADHDRYQDSPQHLEFLEKYGGDWQSIRCFDAYLAGIDHSGETISGV